MSEPKAPAPPATMTVKEVAERLGLNIYTVYGMIRTGRFPVGKVPLPGRKMLFPRAQVEKLVGEVR